MRKRTNPSFMNGVPELLILRLLADQEMYGYELVRAIREATGEAIALGEGSVYPTLHALEDAGLLASRQGQIKGRSRIYYRVTPAGKGKLGVLVNEWSRIHEAVKLALGGYHGTARTT